MLSMRSTSIADTSIVEERARRANDPMESLAVVYEFAYVKALSEIRSIAFPLSAAKFVLAGLLLVASGLAIRGRPTARALVLQALAANAIFLAVEYRLTGSVRAACIEEIARASASLANTEGQVEALSNRAYWWWVMRMGVVFNVGALAAAALAITRPRAKHYFDRSAAWSDPPGHP